MMAAEAEGCSEVGGAIETGVTSNGRYPERCPVGSAGF
jgi:hypothetical protein